MFLHKKIGQRGFTLIELLVVISIISLLSSVILSAVNGARLKARDAQRRLTVKQIQNALEVYRSVVGTYPLSGNNGPGGASCITPGGVGGAWTSASDAACWAALATQLQPYLSTLPVDPKQSTQTGSGVGPLFDATQYGYSYFSWGTGTASSWGCVAGQFYVIVYRLEGSSATVQAPGCTSAVNYPGMVAVGSF